MDAASTTEEQVTQMRVAALARVSPPLASLVRDDDALRALLSQQLPVRDELRAALSEVRAGGADSLRAEKRRRLAHIAALDTAGELMLEDVGGALADLADACIGAVLDQIDSDALGVVAMGKLGACELNYYSDIDIMFVTDGDVAHATGVAEALLAELGGYSSEGQAYLVDTNLRPEGRNGVLVRSLDGFLEYYGRWAKPWEFQALLKARACAGRMDVGEELVGRTRALVFPEEISSERIAEIRRVKQRVESQAVRARRRGRDESDDVKLGPGGIRDIEFAIQLLQIVHGGGDPEVRAPSTLDAVAALSAGGYLADDDAAGLAVAYRWLRTVEHRLQLQQERRVRHLPADASQRAALARGLSFRDAPSASAIAHFEERHRGVLSDVRARFEKLFYRPMIEALVGGGATRLGAEALAERLRVLGFRDVGRATRTLDGLVSGTSRRAKLVRVIAPAMLRFLSNTPAPDEGLFGFLRVVEALEGRYDGLGALRDNPPSIAFLARILGSGRLLPEVLTHVPEEIQTIAETAGALEPKDRERLVREANASLQWRDPSARFDGLRRFKRRELLGIAMADLNGSPSEAVGASLADLADACVEAALKDLDAPGLAVIGVGKLGGRELSYSSDIDVVFVHDGASEEAEEAAERLMSAIGEVTPEGQAFRIDAALRPEGRRGGLLARSVASYSEYYERWAEPWERLALIKARVAAGNEELGARFLDVSVRHAFDKGLDVQAVAQIRHLKARMERERIPRGVDPRRHLKLGPGGMSDVDFAVQMTQARHGGTHSSLRTTSTLGALTAASDADLIPPDDARVLADAYRFLARLRNRYFLLLGRHVEALTTKPEELEALGIALGFEEQPRQELEETFLRMTRRVRRICEPLIFD